MNSERHVKESQMGEVTVEWGAWLEGVVSYGRLAKTSWMCPPPKRNAGNSRH